MIYVDTDILVNATFSSFTDIFKFNLLLIFNFETPSFTPYPSHQAGNNKGGSITVLLTSCLTGLESVVWQLKFFVFIRKTD